MALEQARVQIDINKEVEAQALQIIHELTRIIPIKIARALLEVKIPQRYAGKAKQQLSSLGSVKKTIWLDDGTLVAEIEIPAGAQQDVIDKLNSITKGEVEVRVLQVK